MKMSRSLAGMGNVVLENVVNPKRLLLLIEAIVCILMINLTATAASPSWWSARTVVSTAGTNTAIIAGGTASDFAAVNHGQLKQFATAAYFELVASLPGGIGDMTAPSGAGYRLSMMMNTWGTIQSGTLVPFVSSSTYDFAMVNLGQLKAVLLPFYDRLLSAGYTSAPLASGTYPWLTAGLSSSDFAAANIGQVKNAFSFDLTYKTDLTNPLPDWWQLHYFGTLGISGTSSSPAGDGYTNQYEFNAGWNPFDYYHGLLPSVTKWVGDNQSALPGQVASRQLVVQVSGASYAYAVNAPITFSLISGSGALGLSSSGSFAQSVTVRTGSTGLASVFFQGATNSGTAQIAAVAASGTGSVSVTFTEMTIAGPSLWLKADAGPVISSGSSISSWADQSGNQNNGTSTNNSYPGFLATNSLNGKPVVHFYGGQAFSFSDFMSSWQNGEVFIILRASFQAGSDSGLWYIGAYGFGDSYPVRDGRLQSQFGANNLYNEGTPAWDITQFHLLEESSQLNYWQSWIDGVPFYTSTSNTPGFTTTPYLGWSGRQSYNSFYGDIAEVLIFSRALSNGERESVQSYLYRRYGIASPPTNLQVKPLSSTQVAISWSGDAPQVDIMRAVGTSGTFSRIVSLTGSSNAYVDQNLTPGTLYTYQIVPYVTGTGAPVVSIVMPASSNAAIPLANLRMWLRADVGIVTSGTGSVKIWSDFLRNGAAAAQTGTSPAPVINVLDGYPTVHFDGSSTILSVGNIMTGATAGEIFAILKNSGTNAGANNGLWNFSDTGTNGSVAYPDSNGVIRESFGSAIVNRVGLPTIPLTQWNIYDVAAQAQNWEVRLNGYLQTSSTAITPTFTASPIIGAAAGSGGYFGGDIAELLIFDRKLTESERDSLGNYLNSEFNIIPSPPNPPAMLIASAVSTSQIMLTWTGNFPANGAMRYNVLRASGTGGAYQLVGTVRDTGFFLDGGLSGGTQYSYEVQAVNYSGTSAYSLGAATTLTTGADIPLNGLRLWLRGDTGLVTESNSRLQMWLDQSGSNNNAVQKQGTLQPQMIQGLVNNQPAIYFDGGSRNLALPDSAFGGMGTGEVIAMIRASNATPVVNRSLWYFGGADGGVGSLYPSVSGGIAESFGSPVTQFIGIPPSRTDWYSIYDITADGDAWTAYSNGINIYRTIGNSPYFPEFSLIGTGTSGNPGFDGEIAEIMVYDHALSQAERTAIGNYMTVKYALAATGSNGLPGWLVALSGTTAVPAGPWNPVNPGAVQDGYYNGVTPTIQIISGNYQMGADNAFLSAPMVVKITNSNGVPLSSAPVTFSVLNGGGYLSSTGSGSPTSGTVAVRTGTDGTVAVWFMAEPPNSITNIVRITAGASNATASATMLEAVSYWSDIDGDGLPDGWEIAYGLNPIVSDAGSLCPSGDGLTLYQAFIYGINPVASSPSASGDGIPDWWAVAHGIDPLARNASAYSDQSGLTNWEEYQINANTVGLWPFSTGSGTVAADTSGLNHPGVFGGSAAWSTGFQSGLAVAFDGTASYVTMGVQSAFQFAQKSFTVACSVETSATSEQRLASTGGGNGKNGYYLGMKNGVICMSVGANGVVGNSLQFNTANSFNDGQWHYLAAVIDMAAGVARIYVDGNLQTVNPSPGSIGTTGSQSVVFPTSNSLNASGTGALVMGRDSDGGYCFSGSMYGPALYSAALDAAQVAYLSGPEINLPPTVSITSPVAGTLAQPASAANLGVIAGDADGTVAKVEYYDAGTKIAQSTVAPFAASWQSPSAGTHSLSAKVTDNRSATTVSAVVQITVRAVSNTNHANIPDSWELQYFGVNNLAQTTVDQNGFTYLTDFLEGRNPTVVAVPDTHGDLGLTVLTPLDN